MPTTGSILVGLILSQLKRLQELKKVSHGRLQSFSTDLVFVVLSVRTAFLLDQFSVQDPCQTFSLLLESLRKVAIIFRHVIHLYEPASGQSFFVNTKLFTRLNLENLNTGHQPSSGDGASLPVRSTAIDSDPEESSSQFPSFIQLSSGNTTPTEGPFKLLRFPPIGLIEVLRFIDRKIQFSADEGRGSGPADQGLPSTVTLPSLDMLTSVSLAAILLEYAIAYCPVPSEEGTSFLAQVPLDVYECIVDPLPPSSDPRKIALCDFVTKPYTLLQFSCPCGIAGSSDGVAKLGAGDHPQASYSPAKIINYLENRFQKRLEAVVPGTSIRVAHTIRTLDRLAL